MENCLFFQIKETIFQFFANQWASFPMENLSRPIKILFYKWCSQNGLQNKFLSYDRGETRRTLTQAIVLLMALVMFK